MSEKEKREIAPPEEVLRVITRIMRGEGCPGEDGEAEKIPVSERRRAAELLARRYGLLEEAENTRTEARRQAALAIEAAVARMRQELAGGGAAPSHGEEE